MTSVLRLLGAAVLTAASLVACSSGDEGDPGAPRGSTSTGAQGAELALDHMQVLGTHNSYHVAPDPRLIEAMRVIQPDWGRSFEYTHAPLATQLAEQGIRQIELDVYHDPEGGHLATRHGLALIGEDPVSSEPAMAEPGYKVLHQPDVDFETTCLTLSLCLEEVAGWSSRNPAHVPLFVLVEAKDTTFDLAADLGWTIPLPISAPELDLLDAEIRSVFPPERLLTPDDLRGDHPTLAAAVQADGWPSIEASRGQVLFALWGPDRIRAAYLDEHPNLEDRVMFVSSPPGEATAAFLNVDDPVEHADRIIEAVDAGLLVRTRADAELEEGRSGDRTRLDAALASGAHFVSTDFPEPRPELGSDYSATVPEGEPVGCNPITAPADCTPTRLEDPETLAD